jgi:hypothetical protein
MDFSPAASAYIQRRIVEFRSRGKVVGKIETTYENKMQVSSWGARIRLPLWLRSMRWLTPATKPNFKPVLVA